MNKEELAVLEQVLNEELESYLDSGYSLSSEWVITIRNLLKKLNLSEYWNYDKRYKDNEVE